MVKSFMAIAKDEPTLAKTDTRSGQWVEITMKKGRKGKRKETISSKDIVFTKGENSPSKTTREVTSDTKSECDNQEPLHPLPKLSGAECIVKATKKKVQTKSTFILDPSLDKKVDSSTEQLLLTLIKEATSSKKTLKIPKPFIPYKYCGSNDHHSDECEYYLRCDICGSIAHEPSKCDKKTLPNNKKPRIATQQYNEPTEKHEKTAYDVFIHNHRDCLGKFNEKADDGFFLGYSEVAKTFRVFNIRRKEKEEMYHVTFNEADEVITQTIIEGDEINFNENRFFPNDEFLAGVTTSSRVRDSKATSVHNCLYVNFLSDIEPKKTLVPTPNGKTIIGTKWIFRNKMDKNGVVIRNKVRLVAQGHRQEKGIDYDENFAPFKRLKAIGIFLAYAAYMGFVVLYKALYGLKQAPRACENINSLPPNETMTIGLETIELVDEKNPNPSSTDLVNSSLLRIRYFSPIWRVFMMHIVKCLGGNILFSDLVAKLVNGKKGREPNTLILSSEKVNVDNITDKSLYGTAMQSVIQPKAPTGRKPKKKKIQSFFKPMNSHYVKRSKTKETVIYTHHAKESVATADTTQSLNAFESAEELRNRHDTADAKMVIDIGEVDFDLELMPDDEIMSISRDDNEEAVFNQELSTADEKVADNILDELINEANKEDTNVFAATTNKETIEEDKESQEKPELTTTNDTRSTEVLAPAQGNHKPPIHQHRYAVSSLMDMAYWLLEQ
uniref:Cysteine-rich RLK (Receptor-like protein kinase) 8 n=1 Tax=Tanacetum cinerariifolium TaxID=118510 RepID=A0A6L2JK93_TANCI|nr:cysteine-rich RLK (receptor-like protein kinase) 8 [Tanacetum cinerariifolium]